MSMPNVLLALARFFNTARCLPAAISQSFNPPTAAVASIVDLQFNFIHTSMRKLDWALWQGRRRCSRSMLSAFPLRRWRSGLLCSSATACSTNMYSRVSYSDSKTVPHTKRVAHTIAGMTRVLSGVARFCALHI